MKNVLVVLVVAALFIPTGASAWGAKGHAIVANIAFHYLDKASQEKLSRYLGGMSLDEAASWMDHIRNDPKYGNMGSLHYLNLEPGLTYKAGVTPDVVSELDDVISELSHPAGLSEEQVRVDLLILLHLVGDIHQPLHVGYGSDKGGNDMQVSVEGKGSNLHRLWDSQIIDEMHIGEEQCLALTSAAGVRVQIPVTPASVLNWVNEGRSLLPAVYRLDGHKVDHAYLETNALTVERQLARAGERLSAALMQLLPGLPEASAAAHVENVAPSAPVSAQASTIAPEDAAKFIGQEVTVRGKVFGARFLDHSNGQPTLINMGAAYPNSPLTLVIYGENRAAFNGKPEEMYAGKTITVTGKVKDYNGKAEIIVVSPAQIKAD